MRRVALALALVLVAALGASAAAQEPDPAGDAFRAATRTLAEGDHAGAQAAFEAVAALDPTGPWADDALSEAAAAAERAGDLAAARRLWRRVLDEHGGSRQARRARARVAALEQAIGAGGQWLEVAQQHEAILRAAAGKSDPTEHAVALAALVAAHPDYPRVDEARLWVGDTWMRLGQPGRAAAVYAEGRDRATDPDDRWRFGKALGDALAAAGDLDGAERLYRGMKGEGDGLADRALDGALRDVDRMRLRARLMLAAWAILGGALLLFVVGIWRGAGGWRATARALARPPLEVWYFLPVAAVLLGVSLTGNFLVARAVRTILLGGLAMTWLGGASLEAARRRGRLGAPRVLLHLVGFLLATVAVAYLAIMNDRLIDMVRETWTHGHEGR